MLIRLAAAVSLALTFAAPLAQAGIIEDLLAKPSVQALLGRLPDAQNTVKSCADAKYLQRNAKLCQEAAEAVRIAGIPPDLRAVLATPNGSASIRQLCLAVQGSAVQASYLCAELAKADTTFKTLMEQQRVQQAQAGQAAQAAAQAAQAAQQQRAIGVGAEQSR